MDVRHTLFQFITADASGCPLFTKPWDICVTELIKMTKTQELPIAPLISVAMLDLVFWRGLSCCGKACPSLPGPSAGCDLGRCGRAPKHGLVCWQVPRGWDGLLRCHFVSESRGKPVTLAALFGPNLFPASSQAARPGSNRSAVFNCRCPLRSCLLPPPLIQLKPAPFLPMSQPGLAICCLCVGFDSCK